METGSQLVDISLNVLADHFDMGHFISDLKGVCTIGPLQCDHIGFLAEGLGCSCFL